MKALKERILRDGKCFEGGILKVDNFIKRVCQNTLFITEDRYIAELSYKVAI